MPTCACVRLVLCAFSLRALYCRRGEIFFHSTGERLAFRAGGGGGAKQKKGVDSYARIAPSSFPCAAPQRSPARSPSRWEELPKGMVSLPMGSGFGS